MTRLRALVALLFLMSGGISAADLPIIPSPPQLAASAWLLLDADTGVTLAEYNTDLRLPPASLTKMLTSYVAAQEIKAGRLSTAEMVDISVNAWRMQGSRMFIREGTQVGVMDLLRGVVIQSGNDASVALAEHIAGSEDAFVDVMNEQARRLGMRDSQFMNVTGWPHDDHFTTARDLAVLARALIRDHPEHYKLYAEKSFKYNDIPQRNRNMLLWRDPSVDGIKTGHTEAAGYCLVSSALRDGMRLVAVVMGSASEQARATESQKLLSYGFRYFATHRLYEAGAPVRKARIWGGAGETVNLGVEQAVVVTIPRGAAEQLKASLDLAPVIHAPLAKGQNAGKLTLRLGDEVVHETPLVALVAVPEAGFFGRLSDSIALFFLQMSDGDPLAP